MELAPQAILAHGLCVSFPETNLLPLLGSVTISVSLTDDDCEKRVDSCTLVCFPLALWFVSSFDPLLATTDFFLSDVTDLFPAAVIGEMWALFVEEKRVDSQDEQSIKSLQSFTVRLFTPSGHGPLGKPSQRGIVVAFKGYTTVLDVIFQLRVSRKY